MARVRVRVRVLRVRVRVRVLCIRVRVRVLTKGLESESLKIWTRVRLEYTVGLESYITGSIRGALAQSSVYPEILVYPRVVLLVRYVLLSLEYHFRWKIRSCLCLYFDFRMLVHEFLCIYVSYITTLKTPLTYSDNNN